MYSVDLYIRVSTDEQADRGFSQRYQEEVLKRHCELNQIQVNAVLFDDHSAKDFNRPEWNRLLRLYKKSKKDRPRQILFTKWDRFSRNTGDAYSMIRTLEVLGIGVTAIEQPLDLSIPENRLILAVYLATPEVENIRRGLNIKQGIRRAKKEGRCTGMAPVGFVNMTMENGQKYITPVNPLADIMRMAFERIAAKINNIAQAYQFAVDNGFNKSKNCFWRAIRNPLCCGKVLIPATETEIERYVKGIHTPIISEATFFKVQQIINHKKQKSRKRSQNEDLLPLRGFLICKSCGKIMTGSGSQGKSKKYFYYHCRSSCGYRLRADNAHQLLYDVLRSFQLSETYLPFCEKVLKQTIAKEQLFKTQTASHLTKRINDLTDKINRSRELLLKGDIDGSDYKRIKSDCETDLKILTEKLAMQQTKSRQLSKDVNAGLKFFSKLHQIYDEGDIQTKQLLLSVIFKDYLISDGGNIFQTKLSNTMNILYDQNTAFTTPCSCINFRERIFPLFSLEDQSDFGWQNHIALPN
ncbi:recombinase family protein [Chitinophaga pinensis]|nr:recombinase family protein [Chitinophaga pinensis]